MRYQSFCGGALTILIALPAIAGPNLPMNKPVTIDGIRTVCTGVGLNHQDDPRWNAYPLKIVFAGKGGQWLADGDVAIAQDNKRLLEAHCDGPWVLVKLPPGRYRISGLLEGQHDAEKAYAPRTGQGRVILRFPHSGGAVSAEHTVQVRSMAENRAPVRARP